MSHKLGVVITTIQQPTDAVKALAARLDTGPENMLFVIGDAKGPREWELKSGCHVDFWPLEAQTGPWEIADLLHENSYARKNIGYLLAMRWGAECIYETDDDTIPKGGWKRRGRKQIVRPVDSAVSCDWVNPYQPFVQPGACAPVPIWPRGYPLDEVAFSNDRLVVQVEKHEGSFPIQNGLVDMDPDVDAIWRLLHPRDGFCFRNREPIAVSQHSWAPSNSQNTWFFPEVYVLMYLPTYCSIRMLDIWRGYIAQRCLWEMDRCLEFHAADVTQDRNDHDLMADFREEMDGYLRVKEFCEVLAGVQMLQGNTLETISMNLRACYVALIGRGFFDMKELEVLGSWIEAVLEIMGN